MVVVETEQAAQVVFDDEAVEFDEKHEQFEDEEFDEPAELFDKVRASVNDMTGPA